MPRSPAAWRGTADHLATLVTIICTPCMIEGAKSHCVVDAAGDSGAEFPAAAAAADCCSQRCERHQRRDAHNGRASSDGCACACATAASELRRGSATDPDGSGGRARNNGGGGAGASRRGRRPPPGHAPPLGGRFGWKEGRKGYTSSSRVWTCDFLIVKPGTNVRIFWRWALSVFLTNMCEHQGHRQSAPLRRHDSCHDHFWYYS